MARWKSSLGTQFDTEKGCRRCDLAGIPLNEERYCERCAFHVSQDFSKLTPELIERVFSDEQPVRRTRR